MKRFFFGLLACVALAIPAFGDDVVDPDTLGLGLPTREAAPPPAIHDNSSARCRDGMEIGPDDEDLAPQPAAMDGACAVPATPIST